MKIIILSCYENAFTGLRKCLDLKTHFQNCFKSQISKWESIYHRLLKNNQKGTRKYSRFGCAARLSQQLPLIIFHCPTEKTILAASDVEKFHSGHRRYLFEHQKLQLNMSKTKFIVRYRNGGKHIS